MQSRRSDTIRLHVAGDLPGNLLQQLLCNLFRRLELDVLHRHKLHNLRLTLY